MTHRPASQRLTSPGAHGGAHPGEALASLWTPDAGEDDEVR
jgi:hypothetical protein